MGNVLNKKNEIIASFAKAQDAVESKGHCCSSHSVLYVIVLSLHFDARASQQRKTRRTVPRTTSFFFRQLVVLLRTIIGARKCLYAAGPGAHMVAYVCATGGKNLKVLNGGGYGGSLLELSTLRPEDLGGTGKPKCGGEVCYIELLNSNTRSHCGVFPTAVVVQHKYAAGNICPTLPCSNRYKYGLRACIVSAHMYHL